MSSRLAINSNSDDDHYQAVFQASLVELQSKFHKILAYIGDDHYVQQVDGFSTIGQHMRHTIQFLQAVDKAIKGNGVVDYDDRDRVSDAILETSKSKAIVRLDEMINILSGYVKTQVLDQTMFLSEKMTSDILAVQVPTFLSREIMYVIGHGLHHTSDITFLAHMQNINIDRDICVAPSTLEYRGFKKT